MEMQKSNYQIMQGQMAERFLQYNQEQMKEKFHLPCDEEYIRYLCKQSLPDKPEKRGDPGPGAGDKRLEADGL